MAALIINPRRRRRRKAKSRGRARRKMSALQLKYFGKRRHRPRRVRNRTITIAANPSRRRRRSSARRSFRRNPINGTALRLTVNSVQSALGDAVTGAAGALAVDMAMGQAARILPLNMSAQYNADGSTNWLYHGTKAALAIALGVTGVRFLPGTMKRFAARATVGALTVQTYNLGRALLPPELTMGYYNPARIVNNGMGRMGRMGRVGRVGYYPKGNASYSAGSAFALDEPSGRIGEGAIA